MRDTLQAATGRWWRFTKYVLSEGYVRPARGARLEAYDPWADYWRSRERGEVPPYQSLLDLLRAIKWNPSEGSDSRLIGPAAPELLEPEAVHQLLAWCAAHGLLGVLPQRALLLTLAPRFQRAGRVQGIGSGEQLRLVQQEFHPHEHRMDRERAEGDPYSGQIEGGSANNDREDGATRL
jgi:hypothetical protein